MLWCPFPESIASVDSSLVDLQGTHCIVPLGPRFWKTPIGRAFPAALQSVPAQDAAMRIQSTSAPSTSTARQKNGESAGAGLPRGFQVRAWKRGQLAQQMSSLRAAARAPLVGTFPRRSRPARTVVGCFSSAPLHRVKSGTESAYLALAAVALRLHKRAHVAKLI